MIFPPNRQSLTKKHLILQYYILQPFIKMSSLYNHNYRAKQTERDSPQHPPQKSGMQSKFEKWHFCVCFKQLSFLLVLPKNDRSQPPYKHSKKTKCKHQRFLLPLLYDHKTLLLQLLLLTTQIVLLYYDLNIHRPFNF